MKTSCREFSGHLNNKGYGQRTIQGQHWLAHRAAWVDEFGPIPDGLNVLHKCDNPACINPEHLFLGTQKDNVRDMYEKGRASIGEKHAVKLQAKDVIQIRQMIIDGIFQREIAEVFNISQSMVSRIVNNERWKGLNNGNTNS